MRAVLGRAARDPLARAWGWLGLWIVTSTLILAHLPVTTRAVGDAALTLGTTLVAYALVRGRAQRPSAASRGWSHYAHSLLLGALAQGILVVGALQGEISTPVAWGVALLLVLGDLLLASGLLRWPWGQPASGRPGPALVGSVVFLGALMVLAWQLFVATPALDPTLALSRRAPLPFLWVLVAGAMLRAVVVGGAGLFLVSEAPRRLTGPLGYVLASVALQLLAVGEVLHHLLYHVGAWTMLTPGLALGQAAPLLGALAVYRPDSETAPGAGRRLPEPVVIGLTGLPLLVLAVFLWRFDPAMARTHVIPLLALVAIVGLFLRQMVLVHLLRTANRTLAAHLEAQAQRLTQKHAILQRTERVHALATIGAVLTHDLNSLFGTMRLSGECLLLDAQPGAAFNVVAVQAGAHRVIAMADRGAQMTDLLQQFAHSDDTPPTEHAIPLDLAAEVATQEPLLRLLVPRSVQLTLRLEAPGRTVLASPYLVQQVLVSLVSNARDALADTAGDIQIVVALDVPPGDDDAPAVLLSVTDTGPGIAPEAYPHLFDPLYSTKGRQGTGMGLPLVRTLMQTVGGEATVDSAPGQGATFRLRFPQVDPARPVGTVSDVDRSR